MKVSDKFFQPPFLVFSLSTISITPQFGTSVDTVLEIHFPHPRIKYLYFCYSAHPQKCEVNAQLTFQ